MWKSVVPALLVQEHVPSPLNCLGTLVENQMTTDIQVYLSVLVPRSVSDLLPVPHSSDYCSFAGGFEIGE